MLRTEPLSNANISLLPWEAVNFTTQEECIRKVTFARTQSLNPYFVGLVYCSAFLFAFVGNTVVIYILCLRNPKRTVISMLVANLAVSDLLVCMTSLWLTPVNWYAGRWTWGSFLCHMFPSFQGASICNSSLTMMLIAAERYLAVCNINNFKLQALAKDTTAFKYIITTTWIISFLLVLPYVMNTRMEEGGPCHVWKCIETWNDPTAKGAYGFMLITCQFGIPVLCMTLSYIRIRRFLSRTCRDANLPVVNAARGTTNRIFMRVLFAFIVCWLPINLLNLLRDIQSNRFLWPNFNKYFILAHMVAMIGITINPLIYAFMNKEIKEQFIRSVPEVQMLISVTQRICTPRRRSGDRLSGVHELAAKKPLLEGKTAKNIDETEEEENPKKITLSTMITAESSGSPQKK